jgi:hypothetical protein
MLCTAVHTSATSGSAETLILALCTRTYLGRYVQLYTAVHIEYSNICT